MLILPSSSRFGTFRCFFFGFGAAKESSTYFHCECSLFFIFVESILGTCAILVFRSTGKDEQNPKSLHFIALVQMLKVKCVEFLLAKTYTVGCVNGVSHNNGLVKLGIVCRHILETKHIAILRISSLTPV